MIDLPAPEMTRSADDPAANSDGWVHYKYDLSFGAPVKVRFVYANGSDSGSFGWGVDDIESRRRARPFSPRPSRPIPARGTRPRGLVTAVRARCGTRCDPVVLAAASLRTVA